MDIKIKKEFSKTVIGFNDSGLPLGERKDLAQLALIAQESQNPDLLKLFEGKLPSIAELKKQKTDAALSSLPKVETTRSTSSSKKSAAKKTAAKKPSAVKESNTTGAGGVNSEIEPVDQNK